MMFYPGNLFHFWLGPGPQAEKKQHPRAEHPKMGHARRTLGGEEVNGLLNRGVEGFSTHPQEEEKSGRPSEHQTATLSSSCWFT